MSTPWRLRLRRIRRHIIAACAVGLVGLALLVGTLSQLLPLAERHPDRIAAWLSERAGQPVRFDQLQTAWTRRGPLLQLQGLRIGTGSGLAVGEAEVLVSMYAGLLPGRSLTELRLRGLALDLQQGTDGRWSVRGLPRSSSTADPLDALRRLGELQVIGGRLGVHAPGLGIDTTLPRIDLRMRVDGDRLRVGVRAWAQTDALPLTAVLDLDRLRGNGQAWLGGDPVDFHAWAPVLAAGGVRLREGRGELNLWLALHDFVPVAVTTDSDLRDVRIDGAPMPDVAAPQLQLQRLQARLRWQRQGDGWALQVARLRLKAEEDEQRLDGLQLQVGRQLRVRSGPVQAGMALRALALSDRLAPGLRHWLFLSRPQLDVRDLQLAGERDGPLWAQGELQSLGFASVGHSPGVRGLGGRFEADADGFSLQLEPQRQLQFDWPTGFGVRHDLHLAGQVVGWRDEAGGWRVGTPAMRVQGTDYAADVRGGVWFQGDGTRPWLQLAARLDDVPMTAAKRFWIHSRMSKAATDWLDMALAGGQVRGGVGLVSGDLDDWPFDNNDGRFEATGHISNGDIRFQRDWPLMRQVDADIAFIGPGFSMHGRGDLAGVAVQTFEAGIPDFGRQPLYVRADTRSEAGRLLAMLRQSPLHKSYGDTLDNLTAAGPAHVTFDLLQPMHHDEGGGHLQGTVDLAGVKLVDKRFALAFDDMRGQARYSNGGFDAEGLSVRHLGQDGRLSLRAGSYVRDSTLAFESLLSANLDAGVLIDRAPEMAWLKPYITGTSPWTIAVNLPKVAPGAPAPPSELRLGSDLVGTRLDLPAPLDKPAGEPLATTVAAQLPMGAGRIDVAFGQRLALAARSHNNQTGVQVTLGSSQVDREPPPSGLAVDGRSPTLDALEWISLARGGGDDDAMPLRAVDVQVGKLKLIGGVFEQTRLQLRPGAQALDVRLDGPSLAGRITVPNAEGGTISGQLERVHWQSLPASPGAQATPARIQAGANDVDPAKLPPFALDIADLKFGKVVLGQAVLRTRPLANGLNVDELRFRAPDQEIDISGRWLGHTGGARTELTAQVRSEDLGGLMQNFDYGGQLRGGSGQAQLQASWSGGPSDFQLGNLQGRLDLNARNGQLLELEPGAGRVLGLLSVTQLPRRLMFDFRDFFSKGFAFNQIDGSMQFGQGMARTDKVLIEGPAANITIRGQADLRNQQFDQTIDVNPRAGNLLTVVGAVAGGPVGAALGAATNAVLSKPLGEIGARTYKVTGPWKEPKVEVIERSRDRPPPPMPAPAIPPTVTDLPRSP
ncbi:TIGR02099 family protein [Stenotrophomonas maltophilia]|uniref:TIGR02099 family protein n=1 Tax=Stenotrophomonas maltophilia TaxID=40324 RepID=A0A1A6XR28_STEMA|nr:YhdP family protein [Stenotrophomonas maltophilia]OBU65059.1 TIGR02099 family protein [Stenotrophomonas maltophilia]